MRKIYLDYQSTTPCDPRVVEVMLPYFSEKFGNPHSRNHSFGWEAEEAVEKSRAQIAALINADPKEIIFTSGATESNNLALRGIAGFYGHKKNHIITSVIEHKCILDTCRYLQQQGFEVTYLPVSEKGLVNPQDVRNAIKDTTCMVSIMAVSNEIGVIQPIAEIGAICRESGTFFHTDAAQAVGKMPVDVKAMQIDLMSISAHKIYGPKGVGALYVSRKPRVRLSAMITGGGQERGMRSGTLAPMLCVGFGAACALSQEIMPQETQRLKALTQRFYDGVTSQLEEVYLNGDAEKRIPGNLNLSFAYVEGEGLMMAMKDLCVSSGSACTSASLEPSYVLRAIGVGEDLAHTSIRFGLGRFTTEEEVDYAVKRVVESVNKLRAMSPLYDMAKAGIDIRDIKWAAH